MTAKRHARESSGQEVGHGDICKRIVDIEFERDWPIGFGATLGNGYTEK